MVTLFVTPCSVKSPVASTLIVSPAAGSAANTFTLSVLGQTVTVSSQTRLADRSSHHWFDFDPQSNPFNISTFQTYLAASASQHLAIAAAEDSAGVLQALSVTILPASTVSETSAIAR